ISTSLTPPPPRSTLFPYTTLFRSQLWPVGFAKDLDIAWGNIVRFPIKQKRPASFAVNHDRIDEAFKHAAIVSATRKWKFRMKQRFIARMKTSNDDVAEQMLARGVPVLY